MLARLCQKFSRLSVPPNSVVKFVESTSTMSPARWPAGDIQIRALNSVLHSRERTITGACRVIAVLVTDGAHPGEPSSRQSCERA
jgi:hypothetical protein